jgi:KUP system potassium uptake protein
MDHGQSGTQTPDKKRLLALTIGAIGVVYGDIGTSPLYAIKECFSPHYGLETGQREVFGILSMIFWALAIVISIKYLAVMMRFDNEGEGGEMALVQLVKPFIKNKHQLFITFALGIFGASLLYGDGVITPAISVLSAIEGVTVAAPALQPAVIPLTILIIFGLFAIQSRGTGSVGRIFGPFTIAWFIVMGLIGAVSIAQTPEVFQAINPFYAIDYFAHHGIKGSLVLGSVFLVMTGGETVYADMGHFGKTPIRRGWFYLVFPCLLLNYFGQGALLLREGANAATVANPFFHLVPAWGVIPLVIMSTLATTIASQAVISGAFSITWQALQLGHLPRLKVLHTSSEERGQIYIPFVNWALFVMTVFLVLQFRSSSNLAAMYGIAVSTTMVITSLIAWHAMRNRAKWGVALSVAATVLFLTVDLSFWAANAVKIPDGGYFPLLLAAGIFMMILTWRLGRELLRAAVERRSTPIETVIKDIDIYETVPGTAIYMTGYPNTAPPAMVTNLKYNRARHEVMVLLTVKIEPVPRVPDRAHIDAHEVSPNFYTVTLKYGFMEQLDLYNDVSKLVEDKGLPIDVTDAIFVLGNETITLTDAKGMTRWRKALFRFMHRNSRTPVDYFGIPAKRALEVGSHVQM